MTGSTRDVAVHDVKAWPGWFREVAAGRKTFELRVNDRDFRPGDVLHQREWDPGTGGYTGREVRHRIGYVMSGTVFGHDLGDHVVMSLLPMEALLPAGYGRCRSCGVRYRLRGDGLIRMHNEMGRFGLECVGALQPPKDADG